jgi:hypothetical protein
MRSAILASAVGLACAFSSGQFAATAHVVARAPPAAMMLTAKAPAKAQAKKAVVKKAPPPPKRPAAKVAPKAPPKKPASKAKPAKKAVTKKVTTVAKKVTKKPVKKAVRVRPGTFAYGLPGNINVIGGGELNFDPYGFLKGKTKLEVNRYRECELTHGRVGMLAAVGFIVQEKFHPLFSGVGGPAIDQIPQLPFAWYFSLGLGITFCEFYRISVAFRELSRKSGDPVYMLKAETAIRPGYEPGQIGFDPLGLAPTDPAEFRLMQEKELAHARLGMIAAAGFLAQEAVTGETWGTVYGLPDF